MEGARWSFEDGKGDRALTKVQGELFRLFYSPFVVGTNSPIGIGLLVATKGKTARRGGRLLKREIRAASSRNKVTMQIQARASRGVKSRRVGGGSNFHETFSRMNEGRRVERLGVLGESLPIVDTFIFAARLLSAIFHCLPLWFHRPDLSRLLAPILIDRRSRVHSRRPTFLQEGLVAVVPPLFIPSSFPRVISFPATAKRFFRNFRNTLRGASLLPGRWKSRVVEPQMQLDSWLHEKNSAGWSIHRRFHRVHAL